MNGHRSGRGRVPRRSRCAWELRTVSQGGCCSLPGCDLAPEALHIPGLHLAAPHGPRDGRIRKIIDGMGGVHADSAALPDKLAERSHTVHPTALGLAPEHGRQTVRGICVLPACMGTVLHRRGCVPALESGGPQTNAAEAAPSVRVHRGFRLHRVLPTAGTGPASSLPSPPLVRAHSDNVVRPAR